jgi:Lon protease-like protein
MMVDVALFPIPDCVVFPGMTFPLHIFEPRYRTMVRFCADTGTMLGVCHVEKIIHDAKAGQTVEETLNTNQATYKPVSVFSAGRCDIEEIFRDGRLQVTLHAEMRLRAVEEIQSLPFSIYKCELFNDILPGNAEIAEAEGLKDKVLHRLLAVLSGVPELQKVLNSPTFQNQSPSEFSFGLFQFLRFEPALQQKVLESPSPRERLDIVLSLLNNAR